MRPGKIILISRLETISVVNFIIALTWRPGHRVNKKIEDVFCSVFFLFSQGYVENIIPQWVCSVNILKRLDARKTNGSAVMCSV